jgi:hypothetical protein
VQATPVTCGIFGQLKIVHPGSPRGADNAAAAFVFASAIALFIHPRARRTWRRMPKGGGRGCISLFRLIRAERT